MRLMPEASWSSSWLPKGGRRVSRLPSLSWATACLIRPIGRVDGAADAQGQGCGADQADGNQQQAGEQAAIAAQQHAVVGQLQLDPAQQAVGFIGDQVAGQVAMAAEHRQQVARGVVAGALQQVRAVADAAAG